MAGLTGFKGIGWDVVQSRRGRDAFGKVAPFLVHCLYEAQEEVGCESVLGRSKVIFSGSSSFDCFAVGYCIAVSKCCWELMFVDSGLGAELVEMLVCGLKSKKEVQGSIKELDICGNPIKQEGVAHLKETPHKVLRKMSKLNLIRCELDGAALDLLSDIIPIMTSLKVLDIGGNPAGHGGTVKLLQALGNLHSLHTLWMVSTNIGCDDIMALSQLIRPTGCLKKLEIGEDMPPECVELMMKTVLSTSSLEDLLVWHVDLSSCWNCFSLLVENHNLTTLRLYHCTIDTEVASCLAETLCASLQNNHTLKHLQLLERWQIHFPQTELDPRIWWL